MNKTTTVTLSINLPVECINKIIDVDNKNVIIPINRCIQLF